MNLKLKYINWLIRRNAPTRQKRYVSLAEKPSAVVLLDAENLSEAEFSAVDKLLKTKFGRYSYVVFRRKKSPAAFVPAALALDGCDVRFGRPKPGFVRQFLALDADLLLDLSLTETLPVQFLAGISSARCKCGLSSDGFPHYDVEISSLPAPRESELLRHLTIYLEMIQSKK